MEYDSASNCDRRLRDSEASEDPLRLKETQKVERTTCTTDTAPWQTSQIMAPRPKLELAATSKSLSSQVVEYYHKYSQNANLDQYFSLPTTSASPEAVKCYYSIYEINSKAETDRQGCIGEEYSLRSYVPRERRRWVRPPLIGQSSNAESSTRSIEPLSNPECVSPDLKQYGAPRPTSNEKNDSQEILTETAERKLSSPTLSVGSHKPLEWDNGADVGYFNIFRNSKQSDKKLSTIERMALTRGCSAALRLDPEGTTESGVPGKLVGVQKNANSAIPTAHSTLLQGNASGSESEIEITPIVKNHLPGILATNDIKSDDSCYARDFKQQDIFAQYTRREKDRDTPKSTFQSKIVTKCTAETRIVSPKRNVIKENACPPTLPLKKSTSMNTIILPSSKLTLKRSQSELNLHAKDKSRTALPLIFNSSSSIATIVNKPPTCDKVIQTSLYTCSQESVGVQVSAFEDEKPLLPKRGTSLQKNNTLTTNNPKGTYRVDNPSRREGNETRDKGFSRNVSGTQTPQPAEDAENVENVTGRANSFEYFPGHVYENVPNGSGSRVSTSDTGRSHSTLPNTSSSINEKLWGDSDSLVRDLERSVNILKNLVDANKCDTEVKKRLIHHVVKRLITAKYTDDKIEHGLEENIPWNPDDARSKVYEREIFQALTKKHNTSNSSVNWDPSGESAQRKSQARNGRGIAKRASLESSSDKMDKNTDRTEMDGRKARMALRADDCPRSTNTTTDPDKSESSECFFPQRGRTGKQVQDIFCAKDRRKVSQRDSTTTTTNSTPPDHNRMLLDAVVNSRRAVPVRSSNSGEQADWRHVTTFSERQFELRKFASSVSEDSKLVSYAEMEKRNQLIWITNEISHLCNLKKLLEEPCRPERSRASPKKSRSGNFKTKANLGSESYSHDPRKEGDYVPRNGINPRINSKEGPWMSHCNLAVGHLSSRSNSVIQSVTKRNSCAQTATNVTGALSKTGGEIVSATTMQNSTIKLVSTGVQTVPQETSTIPALIQSEIVHYVKCPAHSALHFQNGFKYNEQDDRCSKHQAVQNLVTTCTQCMQEQLINNVPKTNVDADNLPQARSTGTHTPSDLAMNGKNVIAATEIVHHCATKEVQTSPIGQKDAKNQINASKSKNCDCKDAYTCQPVKNCECKHDNKRTSFKGYQQAAAQTVIVKNNTASKCDECEKRVMVHVPNTEEKNSKKCTCTNSACGCGNEQSISRGRAPMKHSSKYYQSSYVSSLNQNGHDKLCQCPNDCSCENSRDLKEYDVQRYCNCHSKAKTRGNDEHRHGQFVETEDTFQYKVQNGAKCNCGKNCFCNNSREITGKEVPHGKACVNGKPNYVDEANQTSDSDRNCKYCRRCGTAYRNVKNCSCYQTYLKGIAYELSFSKEDDRKSADNLGALQKVPLSNRTDNQGKTDGYVCRTIKAAGSGDKNSPQRNTLQDYLSRNKADFIHNAETCREYISEISQLRQLRRQKRIQLLAMASTSNVVKSPRISKPMICPQNKVSDEDMKKRLKKRYLRLNEVRQKKRQQEKQEETRRNKLMAKIFCKKLQQKVLRGQVDLSQSVSVISNI